MLVNTDSHAKRIFEFGASFHVICLRLLDSSVDGTLFQPMGHFHDIAVAIDQSVFIIRRHFSACLVVAHSIFHHFLHILVELLSIAKSLQYVFECAFIHWSWWLFVLFICIIVVSVTIVEQLNNRITEHRTLLD